MVDEKEIYYVSQPKSVVRDVGRVWIHYVEMTHLEPICYSKETNELRMCH